MNPTEQLKRPCFSNSNFNTKEKFMSSLEESCSSNYIGESPLPYFIVGIIEAILLILLWIVIKRSRHLASRGFNFASDLLILPIYNLILQFIFVVGICVCVINVFGLYSRNMYVIVSKWCLYRGVSEAIAISFMHNGVGMKCLTNSICMGFFWGILASFIPLYIYYIAGFQTYCIVITILAILLLIFYICNWLLPYKYLHRRPSMIAYARFYTLLILCFITVTVLVIFEIIDKILCVAEISLLILDLLQPFVIFRALQEDSMYWQGLLY